MSGQQGVSVTVSDEQVGKWRDELAMAQAKHVDSKRTLHELEEKITHVRRLREANRNRMAALREKIRMGETLLAGEAGKPAA